MKIVNIAANISSANTHNGPLFLFTTLIGKGLAISNILKITIDINTDNGE
jgi:hypothetical protein